MSTLNMIDILFIIILLSSLAIGFGRGFVSEVVSILTTIAAIAVAILYTSPVANYFTTAASAQGVVSQSSNAAATNAPSYLALGVSFAALFIGVCIIGSVVKMVLNIFVFGGVLGFANRVLGGLFGIIRGLILITVLVFVVQLSPISKETFWVESKYVPLYQPGVVWIGNHVSPALADLKSTFTGGMDDMSKSMQGAVEKSSGKKMSAEKP